MFQVFATRCGGPERRRGAENRRNTMPPTPWASTVNYAPCNLGHDVMVINGSNEVRIRDASEATTLEDGDEPEDQTYYIICAATGVCALPFPACCNHDKPSHLPAQVSISKDKKHDMKKLTDKAFKFASNVYWVTSREAPDNCWSWALAPNHHAVKEHMARVSRDAAAPEEHRWVQRRADVNDAWITLWRVGSAPPHTRGDRGHGGVTFPVTLSEELIETWIHTRGTLHTCAN